jgi:hypothetical protein
MKFEKPELKLVRFDVKDVLTASGNNNDDTGEQTTSEQTTSGEWDTPVVP